MSLEDRYGVKGTTCDGVFFTESSFRDGVSVGPIKVEISRQNSNLAEVKVRMARQAQAKGANVIADFRYGQRKHKTWQLVFTFKWDTESWYGEGTAVSIGELFDGFASSLDRDAEA